MIYYICANFKKEKQFYWMDSKNLQSKILKTSDSTYSK